MRNWIDGISLAQFRVDSESVQCDVWLCTCMDDLGFTIFDFFFKFFQLNSNIDKAFSPINWVGNLNRFWLLINHWCAFTDLYLPLYCLYTLFIVNHIDLLLKCYLPRYHCTCDWNGFSTLPRFEPIHISILIYGISLVETEGGACCNGILCCNFWIQTMETTSLLGDKVAHIQPSPGLAVARVSCTRLSFIFYFLFLIIIIIIIFVSVEHTCIWDQQITTKVIYIIYVMFWAFSLLKTRLFAKFELNLRNFTPSRLYRHN